MIIYLICDNNPEDGISVLKGFRYRNPARTWMLKQRRKYPYKYQYTELYKFKLDMRKK